MHPIGRGLPRVGVALICRKFRAGLENKVSDHPQQAKPDREEQKSRAFSDHAFSEK